VHSGWLFAGENGSTTKLTRNRVAQASRLRVRRASRLAKGAGGETPPPPAAGGRLHYVGRAALPRRLGIGAEPQLSPTTPALSPFPGMVPGKSTTTKTINRN
jgi:hypothetical protein